MLLMHVAMAPLYDIVRSLVLHGHAGPLASLSGVANNLQALGVLAAIITIHETGHFFAARSQNIHVAAFSIGFGPSLFSYQVSIGWGISCITADSKAVKHVQEAAMVLSDAEHHAVVMQML